jgi:exonuclease III
MVFFNLLLSFSFFVSLTNIISVYSSDTQCPFSPTNPTDRRTDKSSIRLVQYNIEWMFYDEYSGCPGSSCVWANQSEVLTHMDYISNIINDLNPDIVNFCEIEGCDEINMLIERTNPSFNPYLIKGTDSSTGQNVGMMTLIDPIIDLYRVETKYSYPITDSQCGYSGENGTTGVSKHYITRFNFTNSNTDIVINVAMISAHLLAYPTDPERCVKREAQATVLQEQIYNLINEGFEVIMIGDLNDWDNLILDANYNKPISQVLDILKGNAGKYSNQFVLKSIGDKIQQSERYSEYWDENSDCVVQSTEFSMIDHILVTPNLYSMVSNAFSYHAYPHSCDGKSYNSDHDPVVIDFQI